jgi:hypothetical protein
MKASGNLELFWLRRVGTTFVLHSHTKSIQKNLQRKLVYSTPERKEL